MTIAEICQLSDEVRTEEILNQDTRSLSKLQPPRREADSPFLEVSRLAQGKSYRKNVYRPSCYT